MDSMSGCAVAKKNRKHLEKKLRNGNPMNLKLVKLGKKKSR